MADIWLYDVFTTVDDLFHQNKDSLLCSSTEICEFLLNKKLQQLYWKNNISAIYFVKW